MQTKLTLRKGQQGNESRFNVGTLHKITFIALALLCGTSCISAPVALVAGFIFSITVGNPLPRLTSKTTSWLLKASVVGIGFGMNVHEAITVGSQGLWLTVCSITVVLTVGYLLGKWMGIDRRMAHLISSGTAICGGSAIAAVAPAIEAKEEEISISLGVVFMLNSIALIIFPIMGHYLSLTQHQFGLWSAIAIHDTSSVVGAAATYGEEALKVATTVKLTRALWIIPISLLSIFLFRSKSKKISIPWFILLFVGAMLLNSFLEIEPIAINIYRLSKNMLVVTLFLIGSSISLKALKSSGIKPIILGVSLWAVISVLSLIAIINM
ncbi:MAG: putative sulfate exporter family transporter [Rikenellaceae bacterium]